MYFITRGSPSLGCFLCFSRKYCNCPRIRFSLGIKKVTPPAPTFTLLQASVLTDLVLQGQKVPMLQMGQCEPKGNIHPAMSAASFRFSPCATTPGALQKAMRDAGPKSLPKSCSLLTDKRKTMAT